MVKALALGVLLLGSPLFATEKHPKPERGEPGPMGPAGQSIVGPAGDDGGGLHGLVGAYASYDATKVMSLNGGVAKDTKNGGTLIFGLVGFKLGKSPRDKEIDRLNARLAALERSEKPVRGVINGKN